MADSVVGALRVLLGLDTAAFSSGLKDASSTLDQFSAKFVSFAKKLAIGAVATKFVMDVKGMINVADELGKASQKFGVPVESLSGLKYAADLADVSFESLGKGLGKLSKAMIESAANPAGETAKNFKALGVSVTDAGGNVKSTETIFGDIAQKFMTMEDGAAKTALAIKIFGKSGADLIPLLNAGRTGIEAMTAEAKKLGIVISAETAARAEQFNDTLKRIDTTSDALKLHLAEDLLPVLQRVATAFLDFKTQGDKQPGMFKNIADTLETTLMEFKGLVIVLGFAGEAFKNFWTIVTSFDLAKIKEAGAALADIPAKMAAAFRGLKAEFANLGSAGGMDAVDNLLAQMARVAAGTTKVKTEVLGSKSAIDSFIESQRKSIAGHQAEADAIGLGIGARERLKVMYQAEAILINENIVLTAKQREQLKGLADDAANAALKVAGAQMKQEAMTPWDVFKQKLQDINDIQQKYPEYAEAAQIAANKAAATMIEAYGSVASTAMGNFAEFFKTFGKGNKEMFAIGKAFSVSQAIINTLVGATKAISTLPPPLSYVAAAGVVAFGMAQVAKIIAEKPPAMALGGSMVVRGAGGVDSTLVPFMATPGERVTVDQNKYGEGGASSTITVAGINAKDYYRGDVLRDLVENLNSAISDGLKIKMA